MKIKTGTYTGDGNDNRTITIEVAWGTPDFIFIVTDAAAEGVWKTSDMAGDTSFLNINNGALAANLIQAFGNGTFQIGDDAKVNAVDDEYYYLAIQDTGDDEFDVETYTGTGDGSGLTKDFNCNYTPDLCFIHGDDAGMRTYAATGDMPAATIFDLIGATQANKFTAFVPDGFTIQNHAQVNTAAETYYCIIIKEVNGIANSGNYLGNATDPQNITVTGYAGITGDCAWTYGGGRFGNMLTTDMGPDNTCPMGAAGASADCIQALQAGGFQVGGANACNENGITFFCSVFKDFVAATTTTTAAPTTTTTTPAPTTTTTTAAPTTTTTTAAPTTTTTTTAAPTTTTTTAAPTTTTTTTAGPTTTTTTLAPGILTGCFWADAKIRGPNLPEKVFEPYHYIYGEMCHDGTVATQRITSSDSPYAVLARDHVIFCDTDGGAIETDLIAGVQGKNYKIINCGSSGYDVTVDPKGTETLYGDAAGVASTLSDGENIDIHYDAVEGWW